jgi:hypothetical protein
MDLTYDSFQPWAPTDIEYAEWVAIYQDIKKSRWKLAKEY